MDQDIDKLRQAYKVLTVELHKLGLKLHPDKTRCAPIRDGFDFCGRFILPHRSYLRKKTAKRGRLAMKTLCNNKHRGETVTSYLALARPCNSYNLRKNWAIEASQHNVVFMRNLTKARHKS